MSETPAITHDNPVDSISNAILCDVQEEPLEQYQQGQQLNPTEQLEGHGVEGESTVEHMVATDVQDDETNAMNEGFWSTVNPLTDAGSGMQVDSEVSWGAKRSTRENEN